jgi:ribonuclease P protein component
MPLPRARRIRRTSEYARVRTEGRSWTGRLLILAVLPLPEESASRFGFTTTRRLGNAVVRNRLRRRFSSIVAEVAAEIAGPHLIVTIPRHGAAGAEFAELQAEWIKLARRAKLLPQRDAAGPGAGEQCQPGE